MSVNNALIPVEVIENKIFLMRGKKVMLDKDLAVLYGVKPIALRQQVKRNHTRFPDDFIFQLSAQETDILVSQNVIPSKKQLGGFLPYAFTEQGVAMLSSVLKSSRAVNVNIQIVRTFVKLREMMATHKDLQIKIENMERKYDRKFSVVFEAIKQLIQSNTAINKQLTYEEEKQSNKKWGFQPPGK